MAKRRALLRRSACRGICAASERHVRAHAERPTVVRDGLRARVPCDVRLREDRDELFTGPHLCHEQTACAKYQLALQKGTLALAATPRIDRER